MLFTPEINVKYSAKINVKYSATCSGNAGFTFMALDNKVPTLAKISYSTFSHLYKFEEVFICADGLLREVVKTVFVNVADETKNETINTPGSIITIPSVIETPKVTEITYLYTPKAGQVWSVMEDHQILILEDTKWPLKCILFNKDNNNPFYLGHDMKIYNEDNVLCNIYKYRDPTNENSNTHTIYINIPNGVTPQQGKRYWINDHTMVIFKNIETFPMEFAYTNCNDKQRWVDPMGTAYTDKEYTEYANQFEKLELVTEKPVNDMVDYPRQFGEYELKFEFDGDTYKVVMLTKNTFKYINGACFGHTRTIKDGAVFSDYKHGTIKTSKFIRMVNEMIKNPIVNGIYEIVYDDGDFHRVVVTGRTDKDNIFVNGTFKYIDSGDTKDFDKDGIKDAFGGTVFIVGSLFIEMEKTVNWGDELKTLEAKENEYREKIKKLDENQTKIHDEYTKAYKSIDNERAEIIKNINLLWEGPNKQYKNVCKYLTMHSLVDKKYYLKDVTLTTAIKEHLLKTLETQLECAFCDQRISILENIDLVKEIKIKD